MGVPTGRNGCQFTVPNGRGGYRLCKGHYYKMSYSQTFRRKCASYFGTAMIAACRSHYDKEWWF